MSFKESLYKNIFYFQDALCGRQIITFFKHLSFTATFTAAVCESLHRNVWRKVVSLLIQCLWRKNKPIFRSSVRSGGALCGALRLKFSVCLMR